MSIGAGSVLPRGGLSFPAAPGRQSRGLDQRGSRHPSLPNQCRSLKEFEQQLARLVKLGDGHARDLVASCALSDWGTMDYALSIFRRIDDDPTPFEINVLMRGFLRRGDARAAVLLYGEMREGGFVPDNFTLTFLLKASAQLPAAAAAATATEGAQLHAQVHKHGFQFDVFVQNSLINMYGKHGEIDRSCAVFEQMGRRRRSVASWSALLSAHAGRSLWERCLSLYGRMKTEGLRPDESTLVSVLSACAHLGPGAAEIGRCVHCCFLRTAARPNVIVQTALVDMYVKSGCLEKGLRLFEGMGEKSLLTYGVVISGLAMHGDGEKALWVFSDMLREGLRPDGAVYVGVLVGCSRAGLLAEGLRCFDKMRFEHRITPDLRHYACLVDLMGRAGKLEKAYETIASMPMEPNAIIWRCLLGACRVHRNLELGELAGRKLLELDPGNAGDYVLLSNMYARARRWEDAARIRTAMVDRGLVQVPGSSTVEAHGKLHRFVSRDMSHPEKSGIREMLRQMEWQLRFEGYSPDTSEVLAVDVDEEERRRMLGGHSQKLAIAFGLIRTDRPAPIRITRNLRMCGDCHTYTELISRIFDREIVVRERNRFHRFRDGACSCGGFW